MTSSYPSALHQENCLALGDCLRGASLPSCVGCTRFGFLPANISFPLFSLFPSASHSCSPWNLPVHTLQRCGASFMLPDVTVLTSHPFVNRQ